MRSLTSEQLAILQASSKEIGWLFDVDRDSNGTVDFRWSTVDRTFGRYSYEARILSFSPITMQMGSPESGILAPSKITITVNFKDNNISGYRPSAFEGATITIKLIGTTTPGSSYIELMSWGFKVVTAYAINQVMTLECQDWFTPYLEGDYPNTPLVSELFPADIMKADNVCVPVCYGVPYIPVRWIQKTQAATYSSYRSFKVNEDQTALFSEGQFLLANCGTDGVKSCWVSASSYLLGITTVWLTENSDDLTSNLTTVSTDHYLLGPKRTPNDDLITYTISQARTPQEVNFKTTYTPSQYTFKQDVITDASGKEWKVVQVLCDDANRDGENDANGFWGVIGKEIYDLPMKFSRSDTQNYLNPASVLEEILEAIGLDDKYDYNSFAEAESVMNSRGLVVDVGLWYRMPREKLISKLLTIMGMVLIIRDKIYAKVLTKASQMTVSSSHIVPGTFSIQRTITEKQKDSGYVTWRASLDDPQDQVNKSVVAAKTSTNNRSDVTIEAEWVRGSDKAQKCAKLALQRILLRDRTISFTGRLGVQALEPGDMITIADTNLGGEATAWDCMVTKVSIRENLLADIECVKFSAALDDWNDISANELTITEAQTDRLTAPVHQGSNDVQGGGANQLVGSLIIGEKGELKTSLNPASSGGLVINNQSMTGYNSSGQVRFQATYGGTDQGDVIIGNYAGNNGIKWDQSDSKLNIKVSSAGGVEISGSGGLKVLSGGDITVAGSNSNPGIIKWQGTSYTAEMGLDEDGDRFLFRPGTNNITDLYIGYNIAWWGDQDARFRDISISAYRQAGISCGGWEGAVNGAAFDIIGDFQEAYPEIILTLYDKTAQDLHQYFVRYNYIIPSNHKTLDLGQSTSAWDDVYADDYFNVADFYFMDRRLDIGGGGGSTGGSPADGGSPVDGDGGSTGSLPAGGSTGGLPAGGSTGGSPVDGGDGSTGGSPVPQQGSLTAHCPLPTKHSVISIDDLAVLCNIRPSGEFDPRTGFELIDDNSLPEWLLAKDKHTGCVLRGPDGKPYVSLRAMISLLMGAVRQLDRTIRQLKEKIGEIRTE